MSNFADKLQAAYRGAVPTMGFRKSAIDAGSHAILLVASLDGAGASEAKAIAGADVDAGMVSSENADAGSFKKLATAMGSIPLGLSLEGDNHNDIDDFIGAGCDFIVFGLKTPLGPVQEANIGKILRIEPSLDHATVRAINELPLAVDGVLVPGQATAITVEVLLLCQRFAGLLGKPLLLSLGGSLAGGELSSLYEAGANGLILPKGLSTEAFIELVGAVRSLPRIVKRKPRGTALLPQLRGQSEAELEEDGM